MNHSEPIPEPIPPGKKIRPIRATWQVRVLVGGAVLIAVGSGWILTRPKPGDQSAEPAVVVSVQVATAERQPLAARSAALGTVFPREQATVSAKVSSQITKMELLNNRMVRAGDVIAVLESADLQAQRDEAGKALQEMELTAKGLKTGAIPQADEQQAKILRDARSNLATARAQSERRRDLYAKGGIAQKDLEAAQLALTLAENELQLAETNASLRARAMNPNDLALAETRIEQARQRRLALDAQLGYTTIRAPISGIVTEQFAYKGEFATPGGKLVTISALNEVIVKAQFPDTVVANLAEGDTAQIEPQDVTDQPLTGKISLISRANDPLNRTVEVWVNLKNPAGQLRSGDPVRVVVTGKQEPEAVVVPAAAVTLEASNANSGTVMVVDSQLVAHEVKVTTGLRSAGLIQIISGVQPGERVVVEGNYALPDGSTVQIDEAQPDASPGEPEKKQEGEAK